MLTLGRGVRSTRLLPDVDPTLDFPHSCFLLLFATIASFQVKLPITLEDRAAYLRGHLWRKKLNVCFVSPLAANVVGAVSSFPTQHLLPLKKSLHEPFIGLSRGSRLLDEA